MEKRLLSSVCALLLSTSVNAGLVGDTVTLSEHFPQVGDIVESRTAVVGAGVEFEWPFIFDMDVGQSSIDIFFKSVSFADVPDEPPNFVGFFLSGLNDSSGNPLIGIENFSTDSGWIPNIVLGSDSIGFNFDNAVFSNNFVHLDLVFGPSSQVPEPATLGLLTAGMAGIVWSSMRRRARPTAVA